LLPIFTAQHVFFPSSVITFTLYRIRWVSSHHGGVIRHLETADLRRVFSTADLGLVPKRQTPAMSPQRSQSALGNIPRVVVRPTWDNVIASSYLIKVLEVVLSGPPAC